MQTKQTIAIIGASGKTGTAIFKNIAAGNYRLLFASEINVQLQPLIDEIKAEHSAADVELIDCSFDACWEADIILAAIAPGSADAFADKIKLVANRKIVVSIANFLEDNSFQDFDLKSFLSNSYIANIYSAEFAAAFFGTVTNKSSKEVLIDGDEASIPAVSELILAAGLIPVVVNHFAVL